MKLNGAGIIAWRPALSIGLADGSVAREARSHRGVVSASWSSRNKAVQKVLMEAATLLSADDTISSLQSSKSLLWKYLGGTMDKKEERNQNLGQR